MKRLTGVLLFLLLAIPTYAKVEVKAIRTDTPPIIDGILDDDIWNETPGYTDFQTFQPDYGKPVSENTIAYSAYDNETLYFAFSCYDSEPDKIQATITSRDNIFNEDWIGVVLDSYNDQQNAYGFMVNPFGIQGDIMLNAEGNGDGTNDFIWESAGIITDDGYTVEIKIPLKSIRFNAGEKVVMGIVFCRRITRYSEQAAYPPFYPDEGSMTNQMGIVEYKKLKYKRTYEILPSFTQTSNREAQSGALQKVEDESGSDIGVTTKVSLTSTLTLDLTLNPDFSQVESDASQVDVNLRYPNFYSEKRPFFLEGIKNFDVAGISNGSAISHVVHTRTIADPSFGLKLSGKMGKSNALSVILARDESPIYEEDAKRPADFYIQRYKKLLKDESYIGGIFTDREHEGGFNRVAGMDALWRLSGTMKIEGNAFYGESKDSETRKVTNAHNADLSFAYGNRNYYARVGIHDISKNFRLDTGYIPRDGTTTMSFSGGRNFYSESNLLQKVNIGYWGYVQRDKYFDMNDGHHNIYLSFGMTRSIYVELEYARGSEVFEGESFDKSNYEIDMNGQIINSLYVSLGLGNGGSPWYDDSENPFQGDVAYRWAFFNFQPTDNFSSEFSSSQNVFTSREDNLELYDYRIFRNKTTYQLNKYLFIRGILDYTYVKYPDYAVKYPEEEDVHDEKGLTSELLIGFTYIPGTVVYLGYGSRHENLKYDGSDYVPVDTYTEMKRGLFFKASYNWRM